MTPTNHHQGETTPVSETRRDLATQLRGIRHGAGRSALQSGLEERVEVTLELLQPLEDFNGYVDGRAFGRRVVEGLRGAHGSLGGISGASWKCFSMQLSEQNSRGSSSGTNPRGPRTPWVADRTSSPRSIVLRQYAHFRVMPAEDRASLKELELTSRPNVLSTPADLIRGLFFKQRR
jgi:hypothetical protein